MEVKSPGQSTNALKSGRTKVENNPTPSLITLEKALSLQRDEVQKLHKQYLNASLATIMGLLHFDKRFVKAEGCRVWDDCGHEYLDFLGAYGALNHGHNHPSILSAIRMVESQPNFLQASLSALAGALAANLAALAPEGLKRSFFCNSGAEAVEGSLKLARIATGREEIIYCQNSFHGKTLGALSVTGRAKYRKPFEPLLPGCREVPYGNTEALEAALTGNRAAAFIVEPVQGEGGIIVPPPGYLSEAARLCRNHGTLFIADEIQTGLGRTGDLFAVNAEGVVPDIMCLSKSLSGGVIPIGVYIATDQVWKKAYGSLDTALLHTSTFGGNTVACAAALAALSVLLEEDLSGQAREKGSYLLSRLESIKQRYPMLRDVRGRGLMIGLEFNQPGSNFLMRTVKSAAEKLSEDYMGSLVAMELLNKHHIITAYTLNNPNVIRLEPPLTVTIQQLDTLMEALTGVLEKHRHLLSMIASGAKVALGSLAGHESGKKH